MKRDEKTYKYNRVKLKLKKNKTCKGCYFDKDIRCKASNNLPDCKDVIFIQ